LNAEHEGAQAERRDLHTALTQAAIVHGFSGREQRASLESEDRQVLERELPPLPADGVELAVVLDRVQEGVQPLQQVALSAPDANAEMQRAKHDLHLVVRAGIVAVERSIDEEP